MDFREKIANYTLGNYSSKDLPDIATSGINQGLESNSLYVLAGLNEQDNSFEIDQYFNRSLIELEILLPNELEAANILLSYYLRQIISSPNQAFELMSKIDNQIYNKIDWNKQEAIYPKETFVGEYLGLQNMYTWYRELQDFDDNSKLFYYNELPRNQQRMKFIEHLVEEASLLLAKISKV